VKIKHYYIYALLGVFACTKPAGETTTENTETMNTYQTIGEIERLDPAIDELISPGTEIEILAEGFDWTEGPLWVSQLGGLVFSDIPPNKIFFWKEGEGHREYLHPSGYTGEIERSGEPGSNGLTMDLEGNLVLCQHGDRRMARMNAPWEDPKPEFITLADTFENMRFNSPNDAVYHSSGDLYFTDPPYGLEQNVDDPAKDMEYQGVFKVSPDGGVTLLTDQMTRPNGLAFSPDEKTFYVANSDPDQAIWMAYDVEADGTISNGRVFFDATEWVGKEGEKGLPDGMKIDVKGNIFATGPGGVWVFSPDGKQLGKIRTTQATSNCAFGQDDGNYLYLTADMYLCRVKLATRGKLPGPQGAL